MNVTPMKGSCGTSSVSQSTKTNAPPFSPAKLPLKVVFSPIDTVDCLRTIAPPPTLAKLLLNCVPSPTQDTVERIVAEIAPPLLSAELEMNSVASPSQETYD